VIIRPQAGPQEQYLSTPADIAFYGGAAGGGKTHALLMEPLRHIGTVAGFGAVTFRRTSPQITNEGGLWATSKAIYQPLGAAPRESLLDWRFPPHGNVIKFAHMEHEKNRFDWQGAQIPLLCFDEVAHFTRPQFLYMLSRNRTTCGVRPYVRATYNPVPADDETGGWIHEFVAWYIDDDGYPIAERSGVVRWFVMLDDKLHWYDSRPEALIAHPDSQPKSFTYILSTVYDNKILLAADPGYLANLMALSPVDQERLLRANHKIKPAAGKVFNAAWLPRIPRAAVGKLVAVCRFWDIAATARHLAKSDPDYTVGVLMGLTTEGLYIVLDVVAGQWDTRDRDTTMKATAVADRLQYGGLYRVAWESQPAAAGKSLDLDLYALFAGFTCAAVAPQGDKVLRAGPLASQAKGGNVMLVDADWTDSLIRWLHGFPDLSHDDHVDASSGAFDQLVNGLVTGGFY
jgi:predicted phage terminase large subunit-like protein